MKFEIKIILEEGTSNKAKGNCFEDLIRNLLSIQQYEIRQNIRFTGMELDLLAKHKQRQNEILYVECKAKEKVTSIELRTFFANVYHHKADFGYFFRTNELEFDAGGLLIEYKNDDRYKSLTFFEPSDIISMLSEANMVFEPKEGLVNYFISKKILAVTYFGDFFIYLVNESNALPTKFIAINAKHNSRQLTSEQVEILRLKINEISSLEIINDYAQYQRRSETKPVENLIEAISEVQQSENWFDYLPASSEKKHFVGRDEIRTQLLKYFKEIQQNKKENFLLKRKIWMGQKFPCTRNKR